MPEPSDEAILRATASVPEHVAHRAFPEETIVLNLRSGMYHGLNATAGHMLDVLKTGVPVSEAVDRVSAAYDAPADKVRHDLLELCRLLLERDLIELRDPDDA